MRSEPPEQILPLVREHLRAVAGRRSANANRSQETTVWIEASCRDLAWRREARWGDRVLLLSAGAVALRHILVRRARHRRTNRQLLALDGALDRLDEVCPRLRRVAEYRFFGALTHDEIAATLKVPVPTVWRDWRMARAWLERELRDETT